MAPDRSSQCWIGRSGGAHGTKKLLLRIACGLIVAQAGCSKVEPSSGEAADGRAPGGGAGKADGADAFAACPDGIELPDVKVVSSSGADSGLPPRPRVGIGAKLDERSPSEFDIPGLLEVPATGPLRQSGWFVKAVKGEKFRVEVRERGACNRLSQRVYGPIDTAHCKAPIKAQLLGPIANDELWPSGTWTAPEPGVYFVTVTQSHADFTLTVGPDGAVKNSWDSSYSCLQGAAELGFRRLLSDGTFVGQTFVEAADWSMPNEYFKTATGRFAFLDEESVILAAGAKKIAGAHEWSFTLEERIMIVPASDLQSPQLLTPCAYGATDPRVVDFDKDGRDDILADSNLFLAKPDGSFVCQKSGYSPYSEYPTLGTVDLDADGLEDIVTLRVQVQGGPKEETDLWIVPHFRRDNAFKPGQWRHATLPIAAWYNAYRAALMDVDGDKSPEIVVALTGTSTGHPEGVAVYAFELPTLSAADSAPDSDHPMAMSPISGDRATLPTWIELPTPGNYLGANGDRTADIDGDGMLDLLSAGRWGSSETAFAAAYGQPDGSYEPPWVYLAKHQGGNDTPSMDYSDYDADGCLDVLLAGSGLTLFRNLRCQTQ